VSRLTAPLAVAATLFAGALAAVPFGACTDGTTPDCSGDAGACGYSLGESGPPGDATPAEGSPPVEAATPQDSAPPEDSAPPADAAPQGDSAPADATTD
jgi:hypothetical protein